jgi:hypothetical protein
MQDAIPQKWAKEFPALPPALVGVLTRLVEADQRLEFLGRRLAEIESKLYSKSATEWTAEQHKELCTFYRYREIADREFHRNWRVLKAYTKKEKEAAKETMRPEKPRAEAEPELPRVYEEPTLFQTVVVNIVDGKTVTAMYPANEEEMRVAATAGDAKRAIRQFEFPDGVPEEYHWVFPEPKSRKAGATRQLEMSAKHWRELAARETTHAEPCPLEATRMDLIRMRLEEEGKL